MTASSSPKTQRGSDAAMKTFVEAPATNQVSLFSRARNIFGKAKSECSASTTVADTRLGIKPAQDTTLFPDGTKGPASVESTAILTLESNDLSLTLESNDGGAYIEVPPADAASEVSDLHGQMNAMFDFADAQKAELEDEEVLKEMKHASAERQEELLEKLSLATDMAKSHHAEDMEGHAKTGKGIERLQETATKVEANQTQMQQEAKAHHTKTEASFAKIAEGQDELKQLVLASGGVSAKEDFVADARALQKTESNTLVIKATMEQVQEGLSSGGEKRDAQYSDLKSGQAEAKEGIAEAKEGIAEANERISEAKEGIAEAIEGIEQLADQHETSGQELKQLIIAQNETQMKKQEQILAYVADMKRRQDKKDEEKLSARAKNILQRVSNYN